MKTYNNNTQIKFNEVLDAIALFYIIRQELKDAFETQEVMIKSGTDSDFDYEDFEESSESSSDSSDN